jgi:SPP1 family predicted phage head-tail adaptor
MVNCCSTSKYNARQLREAVTFQRVTNTADSYGARVQTWAAITGAPTRAMVRPMSGGERYASARTEATSTHKIVCRYFADLTEKDRVLIRGRAYNIRFIANVDFDDQWLEISAELGAAV